MSDPLNPSVTFGHQAWLARHLTSRFLSSEYVSNEPQNLILKNAHDYPPALAAFAGLG